MIQDTIQTDILKYLKEKNEPALSALRYVLSQIKYAQIEKGQPLTDEDIHILLAKEVKKRKESIDMFTKAGRSDLVDAEKQQLECIQRYMPEQMSEKDIEAVVDEIFAALPEPKNPGMIIGKVMATLKGKAPGDLVASIVKRKI